MNNPDNDRQLVKKTIAGDMEAYRKLVEQYRFPLERYVLFLIHDKSVAEDVVQDTFIKAYINLRGYNSKYKFSSWLYRIAHNAAIDSLPKHRQASIDDEDFPEIELADDSPQMSELLDLQIEKQAVTGCLSELPVNYREPVMLYYFDNKSYQEISEILRVSVSLVGVRITRAKEKLRKICTKKGVTHG